MHWLWVIIIGFLAGAIAKLFIAGPGGIIVTTLLGIVGAIFATWLGQQIGWYGPGQGAGFIGSGADSGDLSRDRRPAPLTMHRARPAQSQISMR
jgi:uncharacterized membrane protein YeaQ/YmgE (transglycosylase-associated protein family)